MNDDFDDDIFKEPELRTKALKRTVEESKKQKKNFSDLLENIELDPKIKVLWQQIYENAVEDRVKAEIAWTDLYASMHNKPEEHFKNGQVLSKYMERMEKANAQLLKLSELVQTEREKQGLDDEESGVPSSNEIYKLSESRFLKPQ